MNLQGRELEEGAKHRAAQSKLVYEVAQRVSAELNLNKLLPEIVTAVQDVFNYYSVALFLLNEKTKQLKLHVIAGIHAHIFPKDLSISMGEGMIGRAAATGKIQLSGNVTENPHYVRKAQEKTKSELAVPIKNREKTVIGALDIQSDKFNAFDDTDVLSMETLSNQIAIAIENAKLYKKAQEEIAEKRRAEEELAYERDLLKNLMDNIPDTIYFKDTKSRFVRTNQAHAKVLRVNSPEEAIGKTDFDFFSEDHAKEAFADEQKIIKTGQPLIGKVEKDVRPDGWIRWITSTKVPIKDNDGKIVGTVGISRDITKRKQAEEMVKATLKEKEALLAELHEKNDQITSSIRYAERIQQAILPLSERIESTLPEHFIIFKPRDIVSGDFYWFNKIGSKVVIAVVDCTGHGVPGAFMSMIGNTLLNEIVNEQRITDPALILENLHTEVRFALKQENGKTGTQDGMDVCLCTLELEKKKIAFAGAKRPLYVVRNRESTAGSSEFIEIRGNRKSIGGRQKEKKRTFSNHEIEIQHGDAIYLTSDGFVDQNDSEGKKYGSRRLKKFLKSHADLSMDKQRKMLLAELERHQGEEDQRDDITMVGIRI